MKNTFLIISCLFLLILFTACSSSQASPVESNRSGLAIEIDLENDNTQVSSTETAITSLVQQENSGKDLPPTSTKSLITSNTATFTPQASPTYTPEPSAILAPIPTLSRSLKLASPAMQGEDIRLMQERLVALGYTAVGNPDGYFGKMTDAAVRKFQQDSGLVADGVVGPITWQALFETIGDSTAEAIEAPQDDATNTPEAVASEFKKPTITPDADFKLLKWGVFSKDAARVNETLQSLGYAICETRGDFNLQTEAAVKAFQKDNGLAQDGIVGQESWAILTGGSALPAPSSDVEELQFGKPFRLEYSGDGIAYEDGRLLVIMGSVKRVVRIDPKGPSILKIIEMPNLGQAKDPWGENHPVKFALKDILPYNTGMWIGGATHFGAALGEPAVMALEKNGKLAGGPYKFFKMEEGEFMSLVQAGNETLAFVSSNYSGPSLWVLNPKTGITRRASLDALLMNAKSSAYDGKYVWLSLPTEGYAVVPLNPSYGNIAGPALGPCGTELAFDGKWLWVLQEKSIAAYDPRTGKMQARVQAPEGFHLDHLAAKDGQIAVLAIQYSKPYLIIINY